MSDHFGDGAADWGAGILKLVEDALGDEAQNCVFSDSCRCTVESIQDLRKADDLAGPDGLRKTRIRLSFPAQGRSPAVEEVDPVGGTPSEIQDRAPGKLDSCCDI